MRKVFKELQEQLVRLEHKDYKVFKDQLVHKDFLHLKLLEQMDLTVHNHNGLHH